MSPKRPSTRAAKIACLSIFAGLMATANGHAFTFEDGFQTPDNFPKLTSVKSIERFITENQANITIKYRDNPQYNRKVQCIPLKIFYHADDSLLNLIMQTSNEERRELLNKYRARLILSMCNYPSGVHTYTY